MKWPEKSLTALGLELATFRSASLLCCCKQLFCLAVFQLMNDPVPWYSWWVVGLIEAVAIFMARVRTRPVQGRIHSNNTGPPARLTAHRYMPVSLKMFFASNQLKSNYCRDLTSICNDNWHLSVSQIALANLSFFLLRSLEIADNFVTNRVDLSHLIIWIGRRIKSSWLGQA